MSSPIPLNYYGQISTLLNPINDLEERPIKKPKLTHQEFERIQPLLTEKDVNVCTIIPLKLLQRMVSNSTDIWKSKQNATFNKIVNAIKSTPKKSCPKILFSDLFILLDHQFMEKDGYHCKSRVKGFIFSNYRLNRSFNTTYYDKLYKLFERSQNPMYKDYCNDLLKIQNGNPPIHQITRQVSVEFPLSKERFNMQFSLSKS